MLNRERKNKLINSFFYKIKFTNNLYNYNNKVNYKNENAI